MAGTTTVTVSSGELVAILLAIALACGVHLWAVIEAASRRRWVWLAAIWVTFPLGAIAWLTYGGRAQ